MRTTIQSATAVFIVLASLITPAHGQDTLGDFWDKLQEDVEKVFDKATGEPEAQEPAQTETAPQSEAPVGDDQQYIQKAMHYSLESTNWGDRTTWKNPNTGHHGFVVPLGSGGTQGGQPCKAYMRTKHREPGDAPAGHSVSSGERAMDHRPRERDGSTASRTGHFDH